MIPCPPFPHDRPSRRHFDQVVAKHLVAVVLRPRTAAADLGGEITGKRFFTDEENISVLKSQTVVSVVRMMDLPQYPAFPIHLHRGATLECGAAEVALIRDLAIVK